MEQDRGREAEAPWQIPARGWADILRRAWKDTGKRNLSLVAGGVTYYLLVALFPAFAALVSVYSLVANPADVANSVQSLSGMLPPSTVELIGDELAQLVSASSRSLSLGAVIGIAIALWSGMRGMTGMMTALNIAYAQPERRGFIRFNATALVLTVVVFVGGLIALALVAGLPAVLNGVGVHGPGRWIGLAVGWPLLIVFAMGMVALIYRYGPDRSKPKWKWTSLGVIDNSVDPRINPIHCLCLLLRQLQQDVRLVGPAVGSADLDVVVGVRRAVRSRDQRRSRASDAAGYNG
jgi:membrane protein